MTADGQNFFEKFCPTRHPVRDNPRRVCVMTEFFSYGGKLSAVTCERVRNELTRMSRIFALRSPQKSFANRILTNKIRVCRH